MADSGKGVCGSEREDCDLRQSASVSSTLVYGAAFASAMVIADGLSRAEAQTAITDIDLLNLLLNLEYLQAQFYSSAAGSTSLAAADIAGTGIPGAAVGGRATQFSDPIIAQHAREMATVAVAHLRYMREQLIINGGLAVAQPAIDISADQSGPFAALMRSAGTTGSAQSFDPYANDDGFLYAAFFFQDFAVTLYKSICGIVSSRTLLEGFAGIMATKAYHAAAIRLTLLQRGANLPALVSTANAISDARDMLDGGADLDQGISPRGAASNVAPVDDKGSVFGRTPTQALNIVYLQRGSVDRGGFFPSGVNGTIRTSAAN
jgi:hypothetical protein